MSENKRTQVTTYFNNQIAQCKAQVQELTADERTDEAIFAKVRINVYDIFNTMFQAALQNAGEDDDKVQTFFLTKVEQLPQNWRTSLQKAQDNNDVEKAHIETIKLDTLAEIKAAFEKIWR